MILNLFGAFFVSLSASRDNLFWEHASVVVCFVKIDDCDKGYID